MIRSVVIGSRDFLLTPFGYVKVNADDDLDEEDIGNSDVVASA